MVAFLRTLVAVGAVEALVFAAIYVFSDWRRDRVGWYLMAMGGSTAYMMILAVIGWWHPVSATFWAPGLILFDLALGLQLQLVLRRQAAAKDEREADQL